MTIEERAFKLYPPKFEGPDWCESDENAGKRIAFIRGFNEAKQEQKDEDIQRAAEWLKEVFLEQYLNVEWSGPYEEHVFNDKFFSDFEQAMKGE